MEQEKDPMIQEVPEEKAPEPTPAIIKLRPSDDAMQLEMIMQKSGDNTLPPPFEEIMALLKENSVTYGIDEGMIRALCTRPSFFRPFIIAKGKPPKTGKDGSLTYLVETTRELRPKLRDNGTVDYRDLGFIQNVAKGQPLCEISSPEKGEDGCDIYGNARPGILGKPVMNPKGKNTVFNEDNTLVLAACDGTVQVTRGVIDVQDVLRINGNVDNSTGDIHFVGDIFIAGDIVSGFNVSTTNGSITVKGSVEGATLHASGDIVIGEGINGMERGMIESGGSIKCKFIQSCYIKSDGNIYADSIMYCNLECSGNLELNGKRAALIGGHSAIAGKLTAKSIGTDSHVATRITMASTGIAGAQELEELGAEIKEIDAEARKLLQIMTHYDDLAKQGHLNAKQRGIIMTVKDNYITTVEKRKQAVEKQERLRQDQLEASMENSFIECKGRIHVGVQITFGPLILNVQDSFDYSRISVIDQNIVVRTL